MDSIECDFIAVITELEERCSRELNLVEELQLQGEAIKGLKWELEAIKTFQLCGKLTLCDQLMISSKVSVETIAKRLKN